MRIKKMTLATGIAIRVTSLFLLAANLQPASTNSTKSSDSFYQAANQSTKRDYEGWRAQARKDAAERQQKRNMFFEQQEKQIAQDWARGKYADLYKQPAGPTGSIALLQDWMLNVSARYSYATDAFGSDGKKQDISALLFGKNNVKLNELLFVSDQLVKGSLKAKTGESYLKQLAEKTGAQEAPTIGFRGRHNRWTLSLDLAKKLFNDRVSIGIRIPVVYEQRRLKIKEDYGEWQGKGGPIEVKSGETPTITVSGNITPTDSEAAAKGAAAATAALASVVTGGKVARNFARGFAQGFAPKAGIDARQLTDALGLIAARTTAATTVKAAAGDTTAATVAAIATVAAAQSTVQGDNSKADGTHGFQDATTPAAAATAAAAGTGAAAGAGTGAEATPTSPSATAASIMQHAAQATAYALAKADADPAGDPGALGAGKLRSILSSYDLKTYLNTTGAGGLKIAAGAAAAASIGAAVGGGIGLEHGIAYGASLQARNPGSIENATIPVTSNNLLLPDATTGNFFYKYSNDMDRFVEAVFVEKGFSGVSDSAGGLGDCEIYTQILLDTPVVEFAAVGARVSLPTAQKPHKDKVWQASLGNDGSWSAAIFFSSVMMHSRYLNPHLLGELTFVGPRSVERRVPRQLSITGIAEEKLNDARAKLADASDWNLAFEGSAEFPAGNRTTIQGWDTTLRGVADNKLTFKIHPGMKFLFRLGNTIEQFIFPRSFLSFAYRFNASLKDRVYNVDEQIWNAKIYEANSSQVGHALETEWSYQFDRDRRVHLTGEYTFAGISQPSTLETACSFSWQF